MKNAKTKPSRDAVKKALLGFIDQAVGDRMKAAAPAGAVAKTAEKTPKTVVAELVQKAYTESVVWSDPKAGQALRTKAATGSTGAGQELSPGVPADFFVPLLAAKTFLLRTGCMVLTDYGDTLPIPALDSVGTGAYLAEGASGTDQTPVTRNVILGSFRFQRSLPISGKLIRNPLGQALEAVSDGLTRKTMADQEKAWLSNTAVPGTSPAGLIQQLTSGRTVAATAAAENDEIIQDILAAMARVHNTEVHADGTEAFVMSSVTYFNLLARQNGIGTPLFPTLAGPEPTLFGAKVYVTTAIGTSLLYGVFSHLAIGLTKGPELQTGQDLADQKADMVQAWFTVHGDVKVLHGTAFATVSGADAAYAPLPAAP